MGKAEVEELIAHFNAEHKYNLVSITNNIGEVYIKYLKVIVTAKKLLNEDISVYIDAKKLALAIVNEAEDYAIVHHCGSVEELEIALESELEEIQEYINKKKINLN